MEKALLMGNEAFARGAYEAGVAVGAGYPGTPSTEILENLAKYKGIYCEWAPNEKVALEVAIGASIAGARSIVTMKHVGLNVAADPLMTVTYTGIQGGLVIVVADDPGMHSSQNEQDTRHYGRFAKIPVLAPSDSQEAKDFVRLACEISERFDTPVILRSSTRISHTKTVVSLAEPVKPPVEVHFEKNPRKYIPVPAHARALHRQVEERMLRLKEYAEEAAELNVEFPGSGKAKKAEIGIITAGAEYQYVREFFPEASILKLGMSWPLPVKRIQAFASRVKRLLAVEELDPIFETELKACGIAIEGKEHLPITGEFSPETIRDLRIRILGSAAKSAKSTKALASPAAGPSAVPESPAARAPIEGLPIRAPVLCPGCPHRGVFYALSRLDVVVTGDIGCYSLGFAPPFNRMDTIICMGAAVGVMHGMEKAGLDKPLVGVIGDSTFLHSGITGLMDVVYNKGCGTLLILDNRTTAMTGHQEHPATGRTLLGEKTYAVSFEEIAKACGVKRVFTVDPYELEATYEIIKREIAVAEPSVIIAARECVLIPHEKYGREIQVNEEACKGCGKCVKLGCPAMETYLESGKKKVRINKVLCAECGMCVQTCPFEMIAANERPDAEGEVFS